MLSCLHPEEFGGLGQDCDTRFAVWSDRMDANADRSGCLPSCHFGRMCVDAKTKATNDFLMRGRLGMKRRLAVRGGLGRQAYGI